MVYKYLKFSAKNKKIIALFLLILLLCLQNNGKTKTEATI